MIRLLSFSSALLVSVWLLTPAASAAAPLQLTLPSADSYSYWLQSKRGPLVALPVSVAHQTSVKITAPLAEGDRLMVLDAHTGEIASHAVTLGPSSQPLPIVLTLSDFQPLSPPTPAALIPSSPPKEAAAALPAGPSTAMRFLTGLLSLLLALGVGWVVLRLIQTRGEPLRRLAKQAGVEVAEPLPLEAEAVETTAAVYTPLRRSPESIPEEAGLPPLPLTVRGPEMPIAAIPALLGLQGLAAGSTFALTAGDVTIGRDGENEIVLAENTVSRRHARVLRDGTGRFTVTDLGSANGVYVNGERVQRAILNSGDEVKIGDNFFRFHASETHLELNRETL